MNRLWNFLFFAAREIDTPAHESPLSITMEEYFQPRGDVNNRAGERGRRAGDGSAEIAEHPALAVIDDDQGPDFRME